MLNLNVTIHIYLNCYILNCYYTGSEKCFLYPYLLILIAYLFTLYKLVNNILGHKKKRQYIHKLNSPQWSIKSYISNGSKGLHLIYYLHLMKLFFFHHETGYVCKHFISCHQTIENYIWIWIFKAIAKLSRRLRTFCSCHSYLSVFSGMSVIKWKYHILFHYQRKEKLEKGLKIIVEYPFLPSVAMLLQMAQVQTLLKVFWVFRLLRKLLNKATSPAMTLCGQWMTGYTGYESMCHCKEMIKACAAIWQYVINWKGRKG